MEITEIVEIVIALIGAVLSAAVIPWIKARTDGTRRAELMRCIEVAVSAAEQIFPQKAGEIKKNYVTDLMDSLGYSIDGEEVNAAIEAAVLRLHKELSDGGH